MMLTAVMRQLEESGFGEAPREDVAQALREFDGMWRHLSPREQEQLVKALVETVSYDGSTGTVTVGFRSAGVKQLCLLHQEVQR
jgi:site-specific DNA recombinase